MNRQERSVAVVVVGMVALGAFLINYAKPHLGKPGLAFEKVALTNEFGQVIRDERVHLPANVPGFRSQDLPVTSLEATNLPPDTSYGRKAYQDQDGFWAQMSAVTMKTDRTSIHRPQLCVTGQGWKIEKMEVIDIPMTRPVPYTLKATCLKSTRVFTDKNGQKRPISSIYVYWFVSEQRLVPTHGGAQWAITRDLITSGTLYPWAYVSCFAPCSAGMEEATLDRVKGLIAKTAPEFQLTPRNPKQTAFLEKADPVN